MRARSLLDLLNESGADIRQGVGPLLLKRERELQRALNAKAESQTRLRSDTPSKEQAEAIAKEIDALGEERSYLGAVTPTTLNSFELPRRSDITTAAKRVYELLKARNRQIRDETSEARRARMEQSNAEYSKAARAFSEIILKPVSAHMGSKRLVIVNDGALQYIPFAALPTPATTSNMRVAENPPLLVHHERVNLPSASTLAVLRRELSGRTPAAKTVAVLADPVFDKDDVRVRAINAAKKPTNKSDPSNESVLKRGVQRAMECLDSNFRLPPVRLTSTEWEVGEIGKLVPAKEMMQALAFAANLQTATSPELSQYRIVHFATHACINSKHPELSGIVLSLVNERGEAQDGFLRMHEIFNLQLPASLWC